MRSILAMTCTLASCAIAFAGETGLTPGNILLNDFNSPAPAIGEYTPEGELITSCFAIQLPLGCSIMPDDRLVTTVRGPVPGVHVFDPDGSEVFTFETPEVFTPGDVSVFSDGTIAVCDQGSNWIETYTVDVDNQTATYTGPIAAPAGNAFFGSFVDDNDNLWGATSFNGHRIIQFSRAGQVLQQINLAADEEPKDVIVDRADGSVWATVDFPDSPHPEEVVQFSADGDDLGGFEASVPGDIRGVGESFDGDLYIVSNDAVEIRRYSKAGILLGGISIVDPQTPVFLTVVPPQPLLGDWDGDGDVDLVDFEAFASCNKGPNAPALPTCLGAFDFDNDLDVDHHDWWVFHQAFTGEILPGSGEDTRSAFKNVERKRVELIPPAYTEVILDVEADPDSPEVIPRRR